MPAAVAIDSTQALKEFKKKVDDLVKDWDDIGREMEQADLHGWKTQSKLSILRDKKAGHERRTEQAKRKAFKIEHMTEFAKAKKQQHKEWDGLPDMKKINISDAKARKNDDRSDLHDEDDDDSDWEESESDSDTGMEEDAMNMDGIEHDGVAEVD
ncbi:Hypothetical protein D9617_6g095550 [Elsinoe fawcettii]|nr:Hypothetical protein D9617_6g095550 [Elsinoe fawcettii]